MIINSLFDRSAAERLILRPSHALSGFSKTKTCDLVSDRNTNEPMFTSQQSTYEDYSNTKRNRSLTKVLFVGKFNLNEDIFQQGLGFFATK